VERNKRAIQQRGYDGYAGNSIRMSIAHENRKREKEGVVPSMVAEEKGSLALKRIKDGNKQGRLTSLTAGLQYAGISLHMRNKQEDEKVKKYKKDKRTRQSIDEVDELCTKCDPKKWKSIHDCTKPQIKTMVNRLSRPGDEKCIDNNGEMWARYQEIKERRNDDRSHLAPGETIATAGNQPVDASASQKVRVRAIAIKNGIGSSINASKISGSDSDLDNGSDNEDTSISLVKRTRIGAWNYPKNYAKKVENLDFLDVFGKANENEWKK
jgi:hypothetical protein